MGPKPTKQPVKARSIEAEMAAFYVSVSEAGKALKDNQSLLDPEKHKIARNTNVALLGMLAQIQRISRDLELLHNKIQPLLKYIEEDVVDWRNRGIQP